MQVAIQYDSKSLEMRNALQESALLRRVRAHGSGCQTLCSVLLEPHRSAIYRRCLFRLGNVHDAEDAAQETMLRALQGIQGFEGRSDCVPGSVRSPTMSAARWFSAGNATNTRLTCVVSSGYTRSSKRRRLRSIKTRRNWCEKP